MTGRCKTLRGLSYVELGKSNMNQSIFSYEAVDMRRGWKVTHAQAWWADPKTDMKNWNPAEYSCVRMKIQTDTIADPTSPTTTATALNPSDNREIGWVTRTYQAPNYVSGVVEGPVQFPVFEDCIIDPDHVVTRELLLSFPVQGGPSSEGMFAYVAWIVHMEEISITPSESILQTIKGMAQDMNRST